MNKAYIQKSHTKSVLFAKFEAQKKLLRQNFQNCTKLWCINSHYFERPNNKTKTNKNSLFNFFRLPNRKKIPHTQQFFQVVTTCNAPKILRTNTTLLTSPIEKGIRARHPRFSRTRINDFTQRFTPENMQFHAKFHGTWPNSG